MNGERVPIKTTTVCIFNLTPPIPSRFLTSTPVCVTRNICFKIQNIPIGIRVYTRTDYIPHKRFNLSPVSNLVPYANVIVAYPGGGEWREQRIVLIRPSTRSSTTHGRNSQSYCGFLNFKYCLAYYFSFFLLTDCSARPPCSVGTGAPFSVPFPPRPVDLDCSVSNRDFRRLYGTENMQHDINDD